MFKIRGKTIQEPTNFLIDGEVSNGVEKYYMAEDAGTHSSGEQQEHQPISSSSYSERGDFLKQPQVDSSTQEISIRNFSV